MSTALWITGALVIVVLVGWRLRRASRTVERILTEEREREVDEDAEGTDERVQSNEGQRKPDTE
jgi:type VI protein secretion system component VasK